MSENDSLRTNQRSDYERDSYDDFLDNYVLPVLQDPMIIFRKARHAIEYVLHAEFMTKVRWWEHKE